MRCERRAERARAQLRAWRVPLVWLVEVDLDLLARSPHFLNAVELEALERYPNPQMLTYQEASR